MFYFAVKHLRWLARAPGLPQLFDALLLGWTCLVHRSRLKAMETLEREALRLPGVHLRVHRFGGIEFVAAGGDELGHLHGHGLLDILIGRRLGGLLIATGQVYSHHVLPNSGWISFPIRSTADVAFAVRLLTLALARRRV